ncbi:ABC-F family ATP-binding cassette domain-containing protein [Sphingobacterium sp. Mn56C]|uniref:ABC-F family ATP-binding cassette domain-containing protein n=1 Tax=Sphingobacterium sp. Mn56C TaxID=3395261 RepID=UPI003BBD52F3
MLFLESIGYRLPNRDVLFQDISFSLHASDKVSLVGNNGVGKSTLLRIINGDLQPDTGRIQRNASHYYVPQIFGQYNAMSLAQALGVEPKLKALANILAGSIDEDDYNTLNDDWTIEERCKQALAAWDLQDVGIWQPLATLSGGQKTKAFLAGIAIHEAPLILLDEPTNHLDRDSRALLYKYIENTTKTILLVSHDRELLNLVNYTLELTADGCNRYAGNYTFYKEQKKIAAQSLLQDIDNRERELRKAKLKERETVERQQKLDARGAKKKEKEGVARIMMNTLRNSAENSSAKIKGVHQAKITNIHADLQQLRDSIPDLDKMKLDFPHATLHQGKTLFELEAVNYAYTENRLLWSKDLTLTLKTGSRIHIQGGNGSGKTTFIQVLLGKLQPSRGSCNRYVKQAIYIDQEYAILQPHLQINEQAQYFNTQGLSPAEINIRLKRFLFAPQHWNKKVAELSGGERLRLILCCMTLLQEAPDLIILDEPTNNLDLQNIEILTQAIKNYRGTLLVISHDRAFVEQLNINQTLVLA